jgi:hypothetical protein
VALLLDDADACFLFVAFFVLLAFAMRGNAFCFFL